MGIILRPYQAIDIAGIRTAFGAGHRSVVYVAPTGSGKGTVFTYIASEMAKRGRRAWILVHRQELLDQTSKNLQAFGIYHGIISPHHHPDPFALLQVASVQTLTKRWHKMQQPNLIICDESHHGVSPSWSAIINGCTKSKVLGVTATPARLDGKGLGQVFQAMVLGPTVYDLTEQGFLAPATCYAPPQIVDMGGVSKQGGDYAKGETAKRVDTPTITGDAVDHFKRICPGVPTVVFCASVVHAEHVATQFNTAGFRAASVDGRLDPGERRARIRGLETGAVQVLTSCEIVSEGLDVPAITAAILLRPTKSLALARQQVGRALRPHPGKARAIILDHVGILREFGLPTDEVEWSLTGTAALKRVSTEKTPGVRQCPRCYSCSPATATVCRECGAQFTLRPRVVEQREGELVELKAAIQHRAELKREVQKARTREELIKIAEARKYHPGWVDKQLQMRHEYTVKYRRG